MVYKIGNRTNLEKIKTNGSGFKETNNTTSSNTLQSNLLLVESLYNPGNFLGATGDDRRTLIVRIYL